jgi:hypothetical protein
MPVLSERESDNTCKCISLPSSRMQLIVRHQVDRFVARCVGFGVGQLLLLEFRIIPEYLLDSNRGNGLQQLNF